MIRLKLRKSLILKRAGRRIRTDKLPITKQLLHSFTFAAYVGTSTLASRIRSPKRRRRFSSESRRTTCLPGIRVDTIGFLFARSRSSRLNLKGLKCSNQHSLFAWVHVGAILEERFLYFIEKNFDLPEFRKNDRLSKPLLLRPLRNIVPT